MKKIYATTWQFHTWFVLLMLLTQYSNHAFGQSVYINSKINVNKISVYIPGNLYTGVDADFINQGEIYIRDSMINKRPDLFFGSSNPYLDNGKVKTMNGDPDGSVVFFSGKDQVIKTLPDEILPFSTIRITNGTKVIIKDTGIVVLDSLNLKRGQIDLQLHNLNLFYPAPYKRSSGFIYGENNQNYIFDSKFISNTTEYDRLSGMVCGLFETSATASDRMRLKSLGINFNVFSQIYTNRGHVASPNAGDGSIRKTFLITQCDSDAIVAGGMQFSYLDTADLSGLGFKESKLGLYKKDPASAVTFINMGGTADSIGNSVQYSAPDTGLWTISESNCKNPPRVVFDSNKLDVCQNVPFTLHGTLVADKSSQSTLYEWYRTIGQTTTKLKFTNLTITDTLKTKDSATYIIKVVDNRGCYSFSEVKVIPHKVPKAVIYGIDGGGYCLNKSVSLRDSSKFTDSAITKRIWDFGTDTICRKNAVYTYATPGTKTVNLRVESNYGCYHDTSRTVTIHALPSLAISAIQKCDSLNVNLEINKTDALVYFKAEWNFGDSIVLSFLLSPGDVQQPVIHQYTSLGSKEISLIVTTNAGCVDTINQMVAVHQPNIVNFSVENHCLDAKANITNQSKAYSGAVSYLWSFGDGTTYTGFTPNKKFNTANIYNIELKQITPACTLSITRSDTVYSLPSASFTVSNACQGKDLTFIPSAIDSRFHYSWNINGEVFTTSIVTKNMAIAGTYTATLSVTNGKSCVATSAQSFTVYSSPTVNFNYKQVCFGIPTRFYNQSSITGSTMTYLWDLGNDTTTTEQSPSYTFADNAGNKEVKLVATSDKGCKDSISQTIEVYYIPHANLPSSISTCGSSYIVDATVNSPAYNVASYQWNNGIKTPAITVTRSDYPYTVKLTTDKGCSSDETIMVSLNSVINTRLPADTAFCAVGKLNALYSDNNCTWEYLENTNATPVFLGNKQRLEVSQGGIYRVSITDQNNCKGNATVNVTINPVPVVNLGDDQSVCGGTEVVLDAGSEGTSYIWNNKPGSRLLNVTQAGKYSVTVANSYGCTSTDDIRVAFWSLPVKNLQNTKACNSTTLDAGNSGSTYLWSNGETGRTIQVTSPGTYSVTVTNINQCSITDMAYADIKFADAVDLGQNKTACEGETVLLNAGIHSSVYSYTWNGKKTTNSTYAVAGKGTYVIELTNIENGCMAADSIEVSFKLRPVVNLGNDRTLCSNTNVTLNAGNGNSMIQWGGTTGFTNIQQQVTITEAGKYWATVINNEGCMGSDTIEIYPSPETIVAEFLSASAARTGDSIRFVNLSYPWPYTSKWRFGDGAASTEESPYHCFYMADTFNVTLSVVSNSCSASVTKPIKISGGFKSKKVDVTASSETFIEILHSSLYPNPSDGNFTFEFQLSRAANINVYLYNLQGSLIFHQQFKNTDLVSESYSISYLSKGIYIFYINYGKDCKTYKVVKL